MPCSPPPTRRKAWPPSSRSGSRNSRTGEAMTATATQPKAVPSAIRVPTFDDVRTAAQRIFDVAHLTPVLTSRTADERIGAKLFFKCENLQRAGAFKFRGAYNAIAARSEEHTSELQSRQYLVCRLLLEKKK